MTVELARHLRQHSSAFSSHLIVWFLLFFFLFLRAAVPAFAQTSPSIETSLSPPTYMANEEVFISGMDWPGGQVVTLKITETSNPAHPVDILYANADAQGDIDAEYIIPHHGTARTFTLRAEVPGAPDLTQELTFTTTSDPPLPILWWPNPEPSETPWVKTDKDDYPPGEIVAITGSGWQPEEIVSLKIEETGPQNFHAYETLHAVADDTGSIYAGYVIQDNDLGQSFVLTATGRTSGLTAQKTFTDSTKIKTVSVIGPQTPNPVPAGSVAQYGANANTSVQVDFNGAGSCTVSVSVSPTTPLPAGASAAFSPSSVTGTSASSQFSLLTISTTAGTTPSGTHSFTVRAEGTGGIGNDCTTSDIQITTATLVVSALAPTTLTAAAASGTYGGTTTLSATLKKTSDNSAVSGKTINFTLNGTSVGMAPTNAAGVATLSGVSLAGINAGTYPTGVGASFTGDSSFGASNGSAPLTVNKVTVTPSVNAITKTYDGTNTATISSCTLTGVLAADAGNVTCTAGSATFANKNVGTGKTVTATGITLGGSAAGNYQLSSTSATTTANLAARAITVTAATDTKQYDGTTSSVGVPTITSGSLAPGDTASFTQAFNNKNVGTGKTLTPSGSVTDGNSGSNYTVTFAPNTTGVITALAITGSITAANKIYNGTTSATILTRTLTGVLGGDVVSYVGGTATFDNKNVGTGKPVTATGLGLLGANAGNYTVNSTAMTTANITALTITGSITADNKVYDGNTSATFTCLLSGAIAGDAVNCTGGTATFDNKNVGTGKTVTATGLSLSGADAGNYTLNLTATATADITAKELTVTGITANNKVYDGNTTATLNTASASLVGVVTGDTVSLDFTADTASFADKSVGTSKPVTVLGIALSGTNKDNYKLTQSTGLTAEITAKGLTVTGITANTKVYDGNATAILNTGSAALGGVVSGDTITLNTGSTTGTFADKNVGAGKTVTISGLTMSGTDAGNYTLAQPTTTASITALAITGSITADNKVYDGTTAATITSRTLAGIISGDVVSYVGGTATFNNKNVGTGKPVTTTGLSLSGADAGNYTVNNTATTTANITALAITGHITASNKVYDGTDSATILTRTLTGVISGDIVSYVGGTATFNNKNVDTGKTVTATGLSLSGADAGNYTVNDTATTTANITALAITGSIIVNNKIYDGTNTATIATRTLSGVIGTDDVTYTGGTASFADENVGTGKTVTATGLSLSGADAGNYTVNNTATTTADITAKELTVSGITANNKVYDGNTTATLSTAGASLGGIVGTDDVSLDFATLTASFADKNVDTNKPVTVLGIALSGTDKDNYTLTQPTGLTAGITAKELTVSGSTANNKVYDGTTTATLNTGTAALGGVVSGDTVTLSTAGATAAFADKNVGAGKTVTVNGLTISGPDAGNYTLTQPTTTADITALAITGSITVNDKVYDRTTSATIATRTLTGVISGDIVSYVGGTATFNNKNVDTSKTVTATGLSLSGADAGNYTVNNTATTTANITALAITGHITASNKVYDGTDSATILTRTLTGVISGDIVSYVGGTATFNNKNVDTSKTVTATGLSLSGADAGNYTVNDTATTTADITARPLAVTATGQNKVYDGTTAATVTLSDNRVAGDVFTASYASATFSDKNVGTGKTVTVSGISISGTDAGNYTLTNTSATTTADITARPLAVTATGQNKVYDGTTAATVTLSDNRVAGDVFTASYASATFSDKNVGTGKTVTVSGISISGTDAGNYTVNTSTTTTANITALAITGHITASIKVYDGTIAATILTRTLTGVISGDTVSYVGGTATFDTKNVGTGKTVPATGLSLSGADAGNYTVNDTATTTANITARTLTVGAMGVNKVYDRTTAASVTLSDNRAADDVLTTSYTIATFDNKNVGTGKTVTVSGISISGADAGNYIFNTSTTTTANITALAITGHITASNKVYDGTDSATILTRTLTGAISGDIVSYVGGTATFDNSNVGTDKTVTATGLSLSGADDGNYTVNTTATTTASILAWTLKGFYQPTDMSTNQGLVWNTVKSGSTVPLKWQVFAGSIEQTNVSAIKSVTQIQVACVAGVEDTVEEVITTTGGTELRYASQFIDNWATPKNSATKCYKVTMTTKDLSKLEAYFKLK